MPSKQKSDKKDRHRKSGQNARYIAERRHAKSHYYRILNQLAEGEAARERWADRTDRKSRIDRHLAQVRQHLERYQIEAGIYHK